ncbi:hypothetical protein BX257_4061 [Streptomyces sp. 3212.3]|uniref:hypothetical protein n=1 Tax=Streptomyces sp. 3212.3 TaxID=1938846 RepID=UPI000E3B0B0D|nr:hypothetical protein [Streptomyces sp. 3212.3]REE61482.1 hypothetical protein BX257_4061 [Streptomyces sp. 3212.3]
MQLAPSALHDTAGVIGNLLGGWEATDVDHEGIVCLLGPRDCHIGMRLLFDGSTIQLWATGGHPAPGAPSPLPLGQRWHSAAHIGDLTEDQDPAVALYAAISDRILPVFEDKPLCVGHRPWDPEPEETEDVDDVEDTVAAASTTGDDTDQMDEPTHALRPEPKVEERGQAPQPEPQNPPATTAATNPVAEQANPASS